MSCHKIIKESLYSRSQVYSWLGKGIEEIDKRSLRECKPVSQKLVGNAVDLILKYPHLGALKGQSYMVYHQLGYIPQHVYKKIKKIVNILIFQEVDNRELLPERTSYTHETAQAPGEIWAEDFTEVRVCGKKFYVGLVIDTAMTKYLGAAASIRADYEMVEKPINNAMILTEGQGPKQFLLSDNGKQYVNDKHMNLLNKLDIVQKRIPSCKPEYNGSIECGIKEFKNVFYNVWACMESKGIDKEKELLIRVQLAVEHTIRKLNTEIPRPSLNGVTPEDVWKGIHKERESMNLKYLMKEKEKKEVYDPWNYKDWDFVKKSLSLGDVSNYELRTKFCYFLKRPLRKIAQFNREVLGN
jgi:transposase InsO family protein